MSNAFVRRLTHTCTILRATTTTNSINETVETYAAEEAEVRCRYVEKQARVFSDERGEWISVPVKLLLFQAGKDVRTKDRFTDVVLEDGTEVAGTFIVDGDLLKRHGRTSAHHVSVRLRQLP